MRLLLYAFVAVLSFSESYAQVYPERYQPDVALSNISDIRVCSDSVIMIRSIPPAGELIEYIELTPSLGSKTILARFDGPDSVYVLSKVTGWINVSGVKPHSSELSETGVLVETGETLEEQLRGVYLSRPRLPGFLRSGPADFSNYPLTPFERSLALEYYYKQAATLCR